LAEAFFLLVHKSFSSEKVWFGDPAAQLEAPLELTLLLYQSAIRKL
jgi:hypothetical protein